MELKKFLHVMVKNILRLKKRKRKKEKGKTHSGRKLHFGRNFPELTGMPETSQNWSKFDLRWNKGCSCSGLHTGMKNSIRSGGNGTKFITLALSRELLMKLPLNQILEKNTKMHFDRKLKTRKYKITFKNI